MADFDFSKQPASSGTRLIEFEKAEVRPGIVNDTWLLIVSGQKPCVNMEVRLVPLFYIRCPEYWGIEVVGVLPDGFCLTQVAPYTVHIPLSGITGSKGIEVIGSNQKETLEVSGGCTP